MHVAAITNRGPRGRFGTCSIPHIWTGSPPAAVKLGFVLSLRSAKRTIADDLCECYCLSVIGLCEQRHFLGPNDRDRKTAKAFLRFAMELPHPLPPSLDRFVIHRFAFASHLAPLVIYHVILQHGREYLRVMALNTGRNFKCIRDAMSSHP
jgi:hypothetical protein